VFILLPPPNAPLALKVWPLFKFLYDWRSRPPPWNSFCAVAAAAAAAVVLVGIFWCKFERF
jgi:hypothetical protein